jgi:hypothetical protein
MGKEDKRRRDLMEKEARKNDEERMGRGEKG